MDTARNQNACSFRPLAVNGTTYLAAIMNRYMNDTKGHGLILKSHYNYATDIDSTILTNGMNMHEIQLVPSANGMGALHISSRTIPSDIRSLDYKDRFAGWIIDTGIREVDVVTGEVLFEWWPHDHISLTQSTAPIEQAIYGPWPNRWSWW